MAIGNAVEVVVAYVGLDWVLMTADVVSVKHPHLLPGTGRRLTLHKTIFLFHSVYCVVTGTSYWAEIEQT